MAELTYRDAVIRGIAQEMTRDPDVVFLGEDIAKAGGVFKATVGLYEQFGPLRVRDTPISEQAILGAAMGAAMTGLKPIAEIMFSDFIAVCFDYIAKEFPKSRYMTNGQVKVPLVVRTGNGGGVTTRSLPTWASCRTTAVAHHLLTLSRRIRASGRIGSLVCGLATPAEPSQVPCGPAT